MHRLALFIAAVGLTLGVAAAATADGVTPAKLTNAGWTCFNDPGAPRIVCSDPGHARPTPGDPDSPPSYSGGQVASRVVARIVSDVSVLCPRVVV